MGEELRVDGECDIAFHLMNCTTKRKTRALGGAATADRRARVVASSWPFHLKAVPQISGEGGASVRLTRCVWGTDFLHHEVTSVVERRVSVRMKETRLESQAEQRRLISRVFASLTTIKARSMPEPEHQAGYAGPSALTNLDSHTSTPI